MLVRMCGLVLFDAESKSYVWPREREGLCAEPAEGALGNAGATGTSGKLYFDMYWIVEANLAAGFIESEVSFIKSLQFLFEVVDIVGDDKFLRCDFCASTSAFARHTAAVSVLLNTVITYELLMFSHWHMFSDSTRCLPNTKYY